tara:strand:+ start:17234 stop:18304 length:1071 start_codon:yes stop_codon:yes gene_type:complete
MKCSTWFLIPACALAVVSAMASCGARRSLPLRDDTPLQGRALRPAGSVRLETWHDDVRQRDVPVQLRLPTSPEPWPLIVMSHGAGGNRTTGGYLAEALAHAGYVVVQVEHPGSNTTALQRGGKRFRRMRRNLQAMVQEPQNWAHRPQDVSFVLDQLLQGPMATRLDAERIGICGHSYGAFTTMAIAGMTVDMPGAPDSSFRDPRVRAAVALSPQGAGTMGVDAGAWRAIAIPLLMVTGTQDKGLGGQPWTWRREPFEEMKRHPGTAYFALATFEGAGHGSFGDGDGGWLGGLLMSGANDTKFHTAVLDTVLGYFRVQLDPGFGKPPPGSGGRPMSPHHADPDVRWSIEGVWPSPRR